MSVPPKKMAPFYQCVQFPIVAAAILYQHTALVSVIQFIEPTKIGGIYVVSSDNSKYVTVIRVVKCLLNVEVFDERVDCSPGPLVNQRSNRSNTIPFI